MSDSQNTPYGYCHCGCGGKTTISPHNNADRGYVKGRPKKFISGHNARRDPVERFWEKVNKNTASGCWEWTATLRNGYGHFGWSHNDFRYAHRVSYELLVGKIPAGLHVDHLCRNRKCCNPEHLEPVPQAENFYRANRVRDAAGRFT